MHFFKKIGLFGISTCCFLAILLVPTKISKGCGPYDNSFYGYSFLNPKVIDLDVPIAPYFAGFGKVFKQLRPVEDIQQKDNLTEWRERFCEVPSLPHLQQVIYKTSLTQMRRLKTVMRQKNGVLPSTLANNSFAPVSYTHLTLPTTPYV